MPRTPLALFVASLLLMACARTPAPPAATPPPSAPPPPTVAAVPVAPVAVAPPATPAPDLAAQLGDASYIGIEDRPIRLANGRWQGEPFDGDSASRPSMRIMAEAPPLRGDLDGDGHDEAATFVAYDGGGSGVFVHLAVFALQDGQAVNIATADVGDRVRIERAAIEDGRIVVDTIESGPNDPACCPATKARHVWSLVDGVLKQATAATEAAADRDGP